MRAGKLNRLIDIEKPTTARSGRGGQTITWQTMASDVPAAKVDMSGKEYWAAQQVQTGVSVRFEMRMLNGISTECRVKYGNTYYDIKAIIDPDNRGRELHLMCGEFKDA